MIYTLVGTDVGLRKKALTDLKKHGEVTRYIYSETAFDLEPLIDAHNLFDQQDVVVCVSLFDAASSKEKIVPLLPKMAASSTVFIIDEPFGDAHTVTKLSKVSEKIYDAREEKKRDTSIFVLCNSVAARDKRKAWTDFIALRDKEQGEAIQGALWWKWKEIWQDTLLGKKTAYTKKECEAIGKQIVLSTILAHRGEKDLMIELEKIVLAL